MMKTLTKLALVSAVAISGQAFAMQSLDDADLSATTGQDGITITLGTATTGVIADAVVVHDKNGITGSGLTAAQSGITNASAGAIVLGQQGVAYNAASAKGADFRITGGDITIKVDADANGTAPVLNVNIGLPAALTVQTGDIYVAGSGGIAAAANAQYSNAAKILDTVEVVLNNATMNIQLGNAPQGAMIKLGGSVTGGLQINDFSLYQPATTTAIAGTTLGSAGIHLGGINIKSAGNATTWNMTGDINATNTGLAISNLGSVDLRLTNVDLGTKGAANRVGDVALLGLALPNVTISGH